MLTPLQVLDASDPIVLPADIRDGSDADVGLIEAVTRSIAGPTGWLGRSLGTQTLLLTRAAFCERFPLPCGPVTSVTSVKYLDADLVEQTVDPSTYRLVVGDVLVLKPGESWPAAAWEPDAVRVTYVAGDAADDVPQEAKRAIVLAVQHLKDLGGTEVFLRNETVEGVGSMSYAVSTQVSDTIERAVGGLLLNLRRWQ